MYDIKNLNIWKDENTGKKAINKNSTPIEELMLSVRSFNCLKRAGCHTVGDIMELIGEDEQGLRKVRNLGARSEQEILESIRNFPVSEKTSAGEEIMGNRRKVIKPGRSMLDSTIDIFPLSGATRKELQRCGVRRVKDLYSRSLLQDPGWIAVRELFEEISSAMD